MMSRLPASAENPRGGVENRFSGVELRFEKLIFFNPKLTVMKLSVKALGFGQYWKMEPLRRRT